MNVLCNALLTYTKYNKTADVKRECLFLDNMFKENNSDAAFNLNALSRFETSSGENIQETVASLKRVGFRTASPMNLSLSYEIIFLVENEKNCLCNKQSARRHRRKRITVNI